MLFVLKIMPVLIKYKTKKEKLKSKKELWQDRPTIFTFKFKFFIFQNVPSLQIIPFLS
jgi:hypothetical protein